MEELCRLPDGWALADDSLAGRVVMVSGATGGLGRAVALAAAGAGACVVLAGRKVRALEKVYDEVAAVGPEPIIVPVNLAGATAADYEAMANLVREKLGRLDALVHAAAHFNGLTPLATQTVEEWSLALKVNLDAPWLLTRAMLPLLGEATDSAVIFVLDDPARMGRAHWGGYGVGKAGLAGLARILEQETESTTVRVHAVVPGPMQSRLRQKAWVGDLAGEVPPPEGAGRALAWLLGAEGRALRGGTVDLRPLAG